MTNTTLFNLETLPERFVVIGGGKYYPIFLPGAVCAAAVCSILSALCLLICTAFISSISSSAVHSAAPSHHLHCLQPLYLNALQLV